MFRGINAINIDAKGRIAVPARYRQELEGNCKGQLILTIDTEQSCLLLYPLPTWEKIEFEISKLPSFHPATRRIQRLLIGYATEVSLDSHSRILIAPLLREYAKLNKQAILLGQGNKIEIWDETLWKNCCQTWLENGLLNKEDLPEELRLISL